MATEIRWSEKASSNLLHIHDYIASNSPFYAERFITGLITSVVPQKITIIAVLNSKMDIPRQVDQTWILD